MASLPPQQQSQRRASPPQRQQSQDESQPSNRRANSQAPSTSSVDSQTVFLNEPSNESATADETSRTDDTTTAGQSSKPSDELKKCWICFQDETEDTPESSSWRTPCPCALTAHEACLLDWIADMEAPAGTRSTAAPADIRCPQCKAEIFLARPRSRVVEAVGAIERLSGKMLLPAVLSGLTYTVALVCSHHGAHTIRMIFSEAEAEAILAPVRPGFVEQRLLDTIPSLAEPFFRDWRGLRIELGLPLIPLTLIASRTTLADAVLPILPIVFFATHPDSSQSLTVGYWPPSAALTLVVLPYLRGIYDEYLERVWGPHERAWLKEIQPRLGNEGNNADDADDVVEGHRHHHNDDEVVEIEVGIELDVFGDDEDEVAAQPAPAQARQEPEGNAQPANAAANGDDLMNQIQAAAGQQQPQDGQNQAGGEQAQNQEGRPGRNNDILISGTRLATTVCGALVFPTLSACAGELIRLLLPTSWTVPPIVGYRYTRRALPNGLLQTRWGRSIVGGCLLVVLKDAVRIYCRWKMAKAHRERRVLDFDKVKGQVVQ